MEDVFMEGIDQDDVIQILRMLEESTFDELHLEMDGLKLVAGKSGKKAGPMGGLKSDEHESIESRAVDESTVQAREEKARILHPPDLEENGFIAIKAPMLGAFYSAPKPGAPPFVEVGRLVSEGDSLCIIEVMKLFNTVKANIRGRIAKICAENGQMVEYQQTLFLVEEHEGAETGGEENAS
jgi:acetyl-CoA carboxylase biotin carboxyl carrier protein